VRLFPFLFRWGSAAAVLPEVPEAPVTDVPAGIPALLLHTNDTEPAALLLHANDTEPPELTLRASPSLPRLLLS